MKPTIAHGAACLIDPSAALNLKYGKIISNASDANRKPDTNTVSDTGPVGLDEQANEQTCALYPDAVMMKKAAGRYARN